MKNDPAVKNLIASFYHDKMIQTFSDLETISGCKGRTLQRKIKKSKLLASYNKNSKFYTLPSLALFNEYGIWQYQGVLFSQHGDMFQTLVCLVDQSTSGYTSGELMPLVHVKTDDALRVLVNQKRLQRHKDSICYVYYSIDQQRYETQRDNRLFDFSQVEARHYLPKDKNIVIAVLVEIIHKDTLSAEDLLSGLNQKHIEATEQQIHGIISHYDLKKKTNK